MDSPEQVAEPAIADSPSKPAASALLQSEVAIDPETLARLVVQCREFRLVVERHALHLPQRDQAPFLYRQLDEAANRLLATIQALGTNESFSPAGTDAPLAAPLPSNERRGFLGRLLRRRRETPAATAPQKETSRAVDLQGTSWTIPVPELLSFLSISRKTGVLWIHTTQETFMLEIKNGALVHATSDQTPEGMRLGDLLVGSGVLEQDQVEPLVDAARAAQESLGSYLLKIGRITTDQLAKGLSTQIQNLFHRLLTSENAVYRFQDGLDIGSRKDLDLNITSLLLESARFHDERSIPMSISEVLSQAENAPPEPECEKDGKPTGADAA